MNLSLIETVLSILSLVIAAYVGWVHRRTSKLEDRVAALEKDVAALGGVTQSLRDLNMKMDQVAKVVYLIAGKEGIKVD